MKNNINKIILYDGVFENGLQNRVFSASNITFKLSDIVSNEFVKLKNNKHLFSEIVKYFDFQNKQENSFLKHFKEMEFDFYQSKDGLSLYFLEIENVLYIFSFGEKQPGRYVLNLEGSHSL